MKRVPGRRERRCVLSPEILNFPHETKPSKNKHTIAVIALFFELW
jgi:hypothetical protein